MLAAGVAAATIAGAACAQRQVVQTQAWVDVPCVASAALPMCDGTSEVLGAYGDIVVGLQVKLQQAKKKQRLSWLP